LIGNKCPPGQTIQENTKKSKREQKRKLKYLHTYRGDERWVEDEVDLSGAHPWDLGVSLPEKGGKTYETSSRGVGERN